MSKKNSVVWKCFDRGNSGSVNCNICKKQYKYAGNTTNMLKHIECVHPFTYFNMMGKKGNRDGVDDVTDVEIVDPESIMQTPDEHGPAADIASPSTSRKTPKLQQSSIDLYRPMNKTIEEKITNSLAYFIATDMMPYSIVEKEGFQFVRNLNPQYKLPSRKTITYQKIPQLYNNTVEIIKNILKNRLHMAVTTDFWTSVAMESYMSVTIHFLSDDWELYSATLACQKMDTDHTAANIQEQLLICLEEWEIDQQKILACTTDCSANMLAAIRLTSFNHLSCFGHVLNTAVNKILAHEKFSNIIKKSKTIQISIAHSYKMVSELRKIQESLNQTSKKIPSASPKWSTLILIEAIVSEHLALMSLFSQSPTFRSKDICLTKSERLIAQALIKGLKQFETISEQMASEKHITASAIIPILESLQKSKESKDNNDDITADIINQINAEIIKYFHSRYSQESNTEHTFTVEYLYILRSTFQKRLSL
ncbi:dna replication-related element factor isoform a [Holotrichia oblita]|uniref:Dna replication-related element factor isoform a n=1 Tax=Holotrichia oblita TaxID=644536 RepID=A0ACB9TP72_HOLOL|nr:dna replication-related element factor isoform a [Holotrichia oblita]